MLNLYARIHLDEIELAVLVKKLERAGAAIINTLAGLNHQAPEPVAQPLGESGGGRLLEHLLMTTLH
jgi:hypothetical protein